MIYNIDYFYISINTHRLFVLNTLSKRICNRIQFSKRKLPLTTISRQPCKYSKHPPPQIHITILTVARQPPCLHTIPQVKHSFGSAPSRIDRTRVDNKAPAAYIDTFFCPSMKYHWNRLRINRFIVTTPLHQARAGQRFEVGVPTCDLVYDAPLNTVRSGMRRSR